MRNLTEKVGGRAWLRDSDGPRNRIADVWGLPDGGCISFTVITPAPLSAEAITALGDVAAAIERWVPTYEPAEGGEGD